MKKTFLLTLCLVLCLIPFSVFANPWIHISPPPAEWGITSFAVTVNGQLAQIQMADVVQEPGKWFLLDLSPLVLEFGSHTVTVGAKSMWGSGDETAFPFDGGRPGSVSGIGLSIR